MTYQRLATIVGFVLVAMLWTPQPSSAQSCGVLPFTGEGDRVSDKILVKLTSMFAEELSNRDSCSSVTEHRAGDIEADCLSTGRCLKKWAKDEGHKYLLSATVMDAELDRHVRIRVSLFERSKGTYTATATRVIMASKDSLTQALPSVTAEVLGEPEPAAAPPPVAVAEPEKLSVPRATSRGTVAEPEPEPEKKSGTSKSKGSTTPDIKTDPEEDTDAAALAEAPPPPEPSRGPDPAASCGVLQFTGGGNRVNGETLTSLTALATSEIDIQGRFDITMEYATEDYARGCAASTSCLAKFATANGHGRMAVATVSDGKGGTIHLKLRLFDPDNGSWERTIEEDLPVDHSALMAEMPPLVAELLTGERPMTAAEVMAQQEEDDIKLDFDMDVFKFDEEEEEDLMVFGEEETYEFMDMEMSAEEHRVKQEAARAERDAEESQRAAERFAKEQAAKLAAEEEDRKTSISIEEEDEDEIVIESADEDEIVIE